MTASQTAPTESAVAAKPEKEAAAASKKQPQPKPSTEAAGVMKRSSRFFIDPKTIVIDPEWNIRFDLGDIDELAASIKAQKERDPDSGGLLHEIGVKRISALHPLSDGGKKHFVVRWGHRRTTAIHLLMKKGEEFPIGIPAKIVDKGDDVQKATIEMFVENTNKALTPLEEAAAYKRLRDGFPDEGIPGMTIKEICAAVGRAAMHVGEMLALLDADPAVKDAVKSGEIGKTQAKNIARHAKGDTKKQQELVAAAKAAKGGDKGARKALNQGLQASRETKAAKKGRTLKMRALSDEQLNELGQVMADQLKKHLKDAGKPVDFDLKTWVNKDDKLALAATFGAIMALRAAAGVKTDLDF